MASVNCYPECNGECDDAGPECEHEAWEVHKGSVGGRCADCGKILTQGFLEAKGVRYEYIPVGKAGETREVRVTDPVTGGQKGQKPERHSLRPQWPQDEVARVYGYGADKYAPHNWRKGYSWSLSLDALGRHEAKFRSGESIDPESGLHHLAHAQFHLDVLMEFERLGLGTDDRVDVQGDALIEEPEEHVFRGRGVCCDL